MNTAAIISELRELGEQAQKTADKLERVAVLKQAQDMGDRVLNVNQAAKLLGLSVSTIREYTNRNVIPHRRVGSKLLFHEGALKLWLIEGR